MGGGHQLRQGQSAHYGSHLLGETVTRGPSDSWDLSWWQETKDSPEPGPSAEASHKPASWYAGVWNRGTFVNPSRAWPPETRHLAADGSLCRQPETYFSGLSDKRQAGDPISVPRPPPPHWGKAASPHYLCDIMKQLRKQAT